jgi:hypothetical protein
MAAIELWDGLKIVKKFGREKRIGVTRPGQMGEEAARLIYSTVFVD